jgi:hypothetical protein
MPMINIHTKHYSRRCSGQFQVAKWGEDETGAIKDDEEHGAEGREDHEGEDDDESNNEEEIISTVSYVPQLRCDATDIQVEQQQQQHEGKN